jgi:DNA-binding IscR family transcriptional regulator
MTDSARANYVCETLQKLGTVSYPQFVAKVAITSGIRSHIIRTHLSEIENAGLITIKSNMIYWNSQSETLEPSRV